MKKLIKTAAVLLMPTAMFAQIDGPFPLAQIDGPHSHDRDSICINRIELANIIDDLMLVDAWLNEDKFNDRHVCEYSHALIVEVIGRLHGEFQEQSLTN